MAAKESSELTQRIFIGAGACALFVIFMLFAPAVWFRPWVVVGVAMVASVGLWEYFQLAHKRGYQPAVWLGLLATWVYTAGHYLFHLADSDLLGWLGSISILFIFVVVLFFYFFYQREQAIAEIAISFFGVIYVVVPLCMVLNILYFLPVENEGRFWLIYIVGVTVVTDMGAYFVGKLLGKHRLAPSISPGKTLEGTIGGLVCGVITGFVIGLLGGSVLSWWILSPLALALAVVGQIGDLAESVLKRNAGVKDSNRLPALGGVLDIVDSLLFNIPLTYLVVVWIHRLESL